MSANKDALIQGIDKHLTDMNEKELEMVLRFIYSLKDFREAQA